MLSKNTLSEKEKMLSGLAHQPFSAELKQLRLQNKERLFELNTQTRPSDINKNIPPNSIVVGNPAKVLRQITQQDREDYLKTYLPNV